MFLNVVMLTVGTNLNGEEFSLIEMKLGRAMILCGLDFNVEPHQQIYCVASENSLSPAL